MKPAPNPMGTAEARAMLDQLPGLYFSILKNTHIEQSAGAEARCSFELPVLGKRTTTAPTALQAIRAALLELTDVLTRTPHHEWPEGWRHAALSPSAASQSVPSSEDDKAERFQAKARQFTIGVTMPASLKMSLQGLADQYRASFAEVARQLAVAGFEDFDERTYSEGSRELLDLLSSEVRKWQPSETEQVMLRVEPRLAVRLRSAAKEYRRSASEFGAMCLAHGLVLQTQFAELEQKVAAYRGAAIRKLAPQVGLGAQAALLSGILAGTIRAPKKVLRRLSEVFEAPQLALTEFFKRSFESRVVPAFKAENGKPQVARSATSWEDAVKSLNLPAEQAKELLELDA
jgi:hypothetical protein